MRNMLQLLGGVAAAGVVAAGATAFTATAGLTTGTAKAPIMGGTGNVAVHGTNARLVAANFRMDAANPNRVTGVAVTIDDGANVALASTSTVRAAFNGTAAGTSPPATGVYFNCTFSSGMVWNCDLGAGAYYSDIASVDVAVAAVTA
jgi:hypothetical protein